MNTQISKIDIIISKINKVNCSGTFGKKAKLNRIEFYKDNISKLDNITFEQIEKFNFTAEVANLAYELKKLSYINKHIYKKIKGIEVHTYAPELNKIVFKNNIEIKAPQIKDIESAIKFLCTNFSFEQLQKI